MQKGRFRKNKNYSDRFYKPDVFDALDKINAACNKADISIIQASANRHMNFFTNHKPRPNCPIFEIDDFQATYSWMMHHSKLGAAGDGVLLGASTLEQLEQNLQGRYSNSYGSNCYN